MRIFILFIFSMVLSTSAKLSVQQREDKLFKSYLSRFNLQEVESSSFEDFELYKSNFLENYKAFKKHNASNSTYKLQIDETIHSKALEFFKREIEDMKPQFEQSSEISAKYANKKSLDWRDVAGVVHPVQDQGNCGSCWAFAAIGALEGQMMIVNKRSEKLSEQELVDCLAGDGCEGGNDARAYNLIGSNEGVTSAALYPYSGSKQTCNFGNKKSEGTAITSVKYVNSEDEIFKFLQNGPVSVSMHSSKEFLYYKSGIYQDARKLCQGQEGNHVVLLVGAGSENGLDYWIMKNSWGTEWGEKGYFRILRNQQVCSIGTFASYPVVELLTKHNNKS